MPRRWKKPRDDETDAPSVALKHTPACSAEQRPGLNCRISRPEEPNMRQRAEERLQQLWAGELKPAPRHPSAGSWCWAARIWILAVCAESGESAAGESSARPGYPSASKPRRGEAFFPMMSDSASWQVLVASFRNRIRSTFREHGVCIAPRRRVTDVISPEDCMALEDLWHDDLLQLLDESKLDPQVAKQAAAVKETVKAWPKHWEPWRCVGLHPNVRRVFAELYEMGEEKKKPETERPKMGAVFEGDLAVGLDNVFWCSAEEAGTNTNPEWLHVDQNHCTGITWTCAQGVLYVWPSGPNDSSTVVWPKSHTEVYDHMMGDPEAIHRGRSMGGQSVKLKELQDAKIREELMRDAFEKSRRVPCPAGSLLLWDSRTVHQGWRGGPRLAMPICWEPKTRRDEAALRRKLWMCGSGVPSSHSAAEGRVHGMAKEARRRC
ncbi:Hypothetical protein SCF082_LOCUS9302 [Durusdinium trenchii]|uniref:Phytanoyl-CoA dioxygenase n=1 Tax=Durusdinium trenchii TaxID=1381693 RepID=A0ABP0IY87_9DINO